MKYLIILLPYIIFSCQQPTRLPDNRGPLQKRLHALLHEYDSTRLAAPNDAKKNEILAKYTSRINDLIKDSADYAMRGFLVKIETIRSTPWRGKHALLADASDDLINYWMEVHY